MLLFNQKMRCFPFANAFRVTTKKAFLSTQVVIRPFSLKDTDECVALLSVNFTGFEPMCRALNWSREEFDPLINFFMVQSAKSGLSVVARDGDTGVLIGCVANQDYAQDAEREFSTIVSKWDPHTAISRHSCLHLEAGLLRNIQPGYCLDLCFGAVLPEYRSRGVFTALLKKSLINAHAKGYTMAIAETTNEFSHAACLRIGFDDEKAIPYRDFAFRDAKPFAGIDGNYHSMSNFDIGATVRSWT